MKEQVTDYVLESLSSIKNKLTGRDDAFEAMMMAPKEEIVDLKGELTIYKAPLGNGVFFEAPKPNVDVPKPKEFRGTRSTDVRRGETGIGTYEEFQKEFKA
ncbi:hypothetical protein PVK06_048559 [Gossypium arboreum]|uniref:Uncharacterized protein n=1 Tax=Gossypium arboreum TaxID=29729 RepID=A0ABR0MGS0_GOSAR|nr:hypothetical protein PVK06_048559 [Gossypium arboreum]